MTAVPTEPEGVPPAPAKPVPAIDAPSLPFFHGALEGRLMIRRCRSCGTFMWPAGGIGMPLRPRCVACFSGDLEWAQASGEGTLYSYVVMHQLYDPAFADEVPYNISIVELDEGVRMMSNIVGCPNADLQIGMPLEVTFERVSDEVALPKFRPRAEA